MKWSTSKTIFWIFSLSISVHVRHVSNGGAGGGGVRPPPRFLDFETCLHVLLPCEMWLDQNGRFSYTPLHFAAKKGNWNDMKLFFY